VAATLLAVAASELSVRAFIITIKLHTDMEIWRRDDVLHLVMTYD